MNKTLYYIKNFTSLYIIPDSIYNRVMANRLNSLTKEQKTEMERRTDYYIHLRENNSPILLPNAIEIKDYKFPFRKKKHKLSAYFFDLYETLRCFPKNYKFQYSFGDIDYEMETPTFVKSRPVLNEASNSVVCCLNKARHFRFVNDKKSFREKKDMIVARNKVRVQPLRIKFLEMFFDHPMCDIGKINTDMGDPKFLKPYLSVEQQLDYKFVSCIEGNDVSTNLKWVMSSNSIAVMPKPTCETWFMEGSLIPDYHYIEVKEDFSDLIEKMNYYIAHPDEAEKIIENANRYTQKFRNRDFELCVQHNVMKKYFELTNA